MLYTITNTGSTNARPSAIGKNAITVDFEGEHVFTVANFTTETTPAYADPEGNALSYVKVITLPSAGELQVDAVAISAGAIVSTGVISAGNFKYIADNPGVTLSPAYSFSFDVADAGSNTLSGLSTGIMGITINAEVNSPPDSVGDNTVNGTYGVTTTFTAADFTTNTTPAYSDPDGDAAYKVKVTSLPLSGVLSFNGSPVLVNQEILLSSVDSGYLVFNQDIAVKGSQVISFNFSISDVGSEQFTA